MKLTSVELYDFRNYDNVQIEFGALKNFFIGKNAQGKTNLLEAIYLLCLSKSFRTRHEKEVIRFSKSNFIIKGDFQLDNGNVHKIIFHCSHEKGKEISIDRKRLSKTSELIGKFPIVISSPDEYTLTLGPPPERRRFVDILLSQMHKKYFAELQDYHRIIQQRNAILLNWRITGIKSKSIIEPWNQRLVTIGTQIIQYRVQFSKMLSDYIGRIYSEIIPDKEELTFNYKPNVEFDKVENIEKKFEDSLIHANNREMQLGTSLIGPHRDDFIFKVNGQELKKYGSRGQHKTVLISLAIAEYNLIKDHLQEVPLILIDDLYSEIDQERENRIIEHLNSMGQVFITATAIHNEKRNQDDRYFFVEDGAIKSMVN